MRSGAFDSSQAEEPLLRRLQKQWWIFLMPFYPMVWIWVGSFLLAFFITQPLQWKQVNAQDNSYVILQVQPFKAWPARQPFGRFEGTALTRNLSGFIEAADLKEIWFVPLHYQVARRLVDQTPQVPPSAFVRSGP